jgi:hypothetical protein
MEMPLAKHNYLVSVEVMLGRRVSSAGPASLVDAGCREMSEMEATAAI